MVGFFFLFNLNLSWLGFFFYQLRAKPISHKRSFIHSLISFLTGIWIDFIYERPDLVSALGLKLTHFTPPAFNWISSLNNFTQQYLGDLSQLQH
jgi:hypothetical protein